MLAVKTADKAENANATHMACENFIRFESSSRSRFDEFEAVLAVQCYFADALKLKLNFCDLAEREKSQDYGVPKKMTQAAGPPGCSR